jgi:hypothetical protein
MELRAATRAAVGAKLEELAGNLPKSGWMGRAHFNGSAIETLRNLAASEDRDHQEINGNEGYENRTGLNKIKKLTHLGTRFFVKVGYRGELLRSSWTACGDARICPNSGSVDSHMA